MSATVTHDTRVFDAVSGHEYHWEEGRGPHCQVMRLIETAPDGQTWIVAQIVPTYGAALNQAGLHLAAILRDANVQGERR